MKVHNKLGPGSYDPKFCLMRKRSRSYRFPPQSSLKPRLQTYRSCKLGPGSYFPEMADHLTKRNNFPVKLAKNVCCYETVTCTCAQKKETRKAKSQHKDAVFERSDLSTKEFDSMDKSFENKAQYKLGENLFETDEKYAMEEVYHKDSDLEDAAAQCKHFNKLNQDSTSAAKTSNAKATGFQSSDTQQRASKKPSNHIIAFHLRKHRSNRIRNYKISFNLVERRVRGAPLFSKAEVARKKTMKKTRQLRANVNFHSLRNMALNNGLLSTLNSWLAPQMHRPWLPSSREEEPRLNSYDNLRQYTKPVFQYRESPDKIQCQAAVSADFSNWLEPQVHKDWQPTVPKEIESVAGPYHMERQSGRDVTTVSRKNEKRIEEFFKAPVKKGLTGPGKYEAVHENTFESIRLKKEKGESRGVQFSKGSGRNDESALDKLNEGNTLELEPNDDIIRPRVKGFTIQGPEIEERFKAVSSSKEKHEDLQPNYNFGRKKVFGIPLLKHQQGRGSPKRENHETLDLQLNYSYLEPRVSSGVSFELSQSRRTSPKTTKAYRYQDDTEGPNEGDALLLSPKFDLGWNSAKGHIAMEQALDRWEETAAENNLASFYGNLILEPERAEKVLSKYRNLHAGVDMSKGPERFEDNNNSLEYHEANYSPNILSGPESISCMVNMDRDVGRWEEKLDKSFEELKLNIRDEFSSRSKRVRGFKYRTTNEAPKRIVKVKSQEYKKD